ncbi:FAD/NAD(P)-binding domain-containing protein [Aspergillus alliaceus]|uniref:FAD/NAD(P)-binding domain-containing protein n=1 Tax=Petromyces alliaceus TaxID=209559 RepID=A0A5N7CAK2_PETAA|nr:FAD/NAD(P)-binding domain-containing protein [Aspergillus alliaceus]
MMAQQPLPAIPSGMIDPASMAGDEATKQARAVLKRLSAALADDDANALQGCFFDNQAYWKDQLALTYHLRTFNTPRIIAASLLETKTLRNVKGKITVKGAAIFFPATPTLQFIDCGIVFRTDSPGATCEGKVVLLPVRSDIWTVVWKVWILSTILKSLDLQPENEGLLQSPRKQLDGLASFDIDVFIIGGGNAAVALAARLKALGVESVMAERNPRPGDNWALRYDCMRFHIPTSFCDLPYMCYDPELQTPHLLARNELALQVRRYVETFNLNVLTANSKHLVLATGIGSQKPYLPTTVDSHLYQGISIHSAQYQNANQLAEKGAQSVLIVGSANTAFDVLEDCHAAGLHTTMVHSLGAYDMGVEAADRLFMTLPTCVDSQLACGLMTQFASQEPHRYNALAAAGFPVLDSRDPNVSLMHNLIERAGGHYVDVGGTKLLAEGKAGIKVGVEPVAFTTTGLRFSDGSSASPIKDVRDTAAQILVGDAPNHESENESKHFLGPREIASRLDATWGIDGEREIRGLWKRQSRVDNFWVMGGYTQQHRWHSRTLALQIKASLEDILPPAYRDTPSPAPVAPQRYPLL